MNYSLVLLQYKLVQAVVNVHFPFSQLPNLKIVNAQRKLLDKVIMLQAAMVAWGCAYSLWKYRLWKRSAKLRISLTVTAARWSFRDLAT